MMQMLSAGKQLRFLHLNRTLFRLKLREMAENRKEAIPMIQWNAKIRDEGDLRQAFSNATNLLEIKNIEVGKMIFWSGMTYTLGLGEQQCLKGRLGATATMKIKCTREVLKSGKFRVSGCEAPIHRRRRRWRFQRCIWRALCRRRLRKQGDDSTSMRRKIQQ
ncbi:hypothetical protein KSP39_PZI002652 [Platanthera zijinensis]|uniref:Uncharacterized protein n=1 Tax=Platanthera zijinensis TaxID=2320716 RepID=A0AAP0BYU2_9ASPA